MVKTTVIERANTYHIAHFFYITSVTYTIPTVNAPFTSSKHIVDVRAKIERVTATSNARDSTFSVTIVPFVVRCELVRGLKYICGQYPNRDDVLNFKRRSYAGRRKILCLTVIIARFTDASVPVDSGDVPLISEYCDFPQKDK